MLEALRAVASGDPGDLPGPRLLRATRAAVITVVVASNLVGAAIVGVLQMVILPVPERFAHDSGLVAEYLAVGVAYVLFAVPLGVALGLRAAAPASGWLAEDRPPRDEERAAALRLPLGLLLRISALWGGAVVLYTILMLPRSGLLAFEVAMSTALGGLATASVAYLLAGRLLRGTLPRLLADAPAGRHDAPGVAARTLFTWSLGTAVPLTGALVLAITALATPMSSHALARATIALCVVSLAVGLGTMVVLARSLAEPLRDLADALDRVEHDDLDVSVRIIDAGEIGYAAAGFNRMVAGLRERERMRDLFGRHVGEDVARRALEEGVTLGGEEREAAALFVDVVGSTTLAVQRSPSEVVALLNAFFAVVVAVTREHGGLVNKFEGDAALCVFGAPLATGDPAGDALAAARVMQQRLRAEVEGLRAGIGVSAGVVVAGNIGAADRFEYTVIGDPVNEAARLTELAKDRPEGVVAAAVCLDRARAGEQERWAVLDEDRVLRGRDAPTRLAVPRP